MRRLLFFAWNLAFLFGFYWFFRWTSWRGMVAFVLGMVVMGWLLLSKSLLVRWLVEMTSSDQYLWELLRSDTKRRGDDGTKKR